MADGAKQVTERGAGRRQRDEGAGAAGAPRPHSRDDRAAWSNVAQAIDRIADLIEGQSR